MKLLLRFLPALLVASILALGCKAKTEGDKPKAPNADAGEKKPPPEPGTVKMK